jgi:hypothetical protein
MLAIKAEIVSEPVDSDTPCEFIAHKINRNHSMILRWVDRCLFIDMSESM